MLIASRRFICSIIFVPLLVSITSSLDLVPIHACARLDSPGGRVYELQWSSDSAYLAVDSGNSVDIYDRSGEPVSIIEEPDLLISDIAWHPSEALIAVAAFDPDDDTKNVISIWEAITPERVQSIAVNDLTLQAVWRGDGSQLVTLHGLNEISFWDAATWELADTWQMDSERVYSIAASPTGSQLAVGETKDGGRIGIYDIQTGGLDAILQEMHPHSIVESLVWSTPHMVAASVRNEYGLVLVWNVTNGELLTTTEIQTEFAISPDGRFLAYGLQILGVSLENFRDTRDVQIVNMDSENLALLEDSPDPITALAWSPDGSRLASGGSEGAIIIYCLDESS